MGVRWHLNNRSRRVLEDKKKGRDLVSICTYMRFFFLSFQQMGMILRVHKSKEVMDLKMSVNKVPLLR